MRRERLSLVGVAAVAALLLLSGTAVAGSPDGGAGAVVDLSAGNETGTNATVGVVALGKRDGNSTPDRQRRRLSASSSHRIEAGSATGRLFTFVEAGNQTLYDVTVDYSVPPGLYVDSVVSVDQGQWSLSPPYWSVGTVPANERLTSTVVIGAREGATPGTRTVRLLFYDSGGQFASDTVTYEIVEPRESPDVRLGMTVGDPSGSDSAVNPGETLPVDLSLSNGGQRSVTDLTVELTLTGLGIWDIVDYRTDAGTWDTGSDTYFLANLSAGETDTPGYDVVIPPQAPTGYYTLSAEVRVDGEVVDTASEAVAVTNGSASDEPPVAAISAEATTAAPGQSIRFDGSASADFDDGIVSYEWQFGNAATATGANVTYAFRTSGTYEVTLTVSDGDQVDTDTVTVEVGAFRTPGRSGPNNRTYAPRAALSVPTDTPTPGEQVTLDAGAAQDSDGQIRAYRWDFDGDGRVDRTTTAPTVTTAYGTPGEYTPSVTVADSDGLTATATTTVTVVDRAALPTASFTVSGGGVVRAGETVEFDPSGSTGGGSDITAYEWSFGDGTTAASSPALGQSDSTITTHTYQRPGTYTVTLTVTNRDGLTNSTTRQLTVQQGPGPVITALNRRKSGTLLTGYGLENTYTFLTAARENVTEATLSFPGKTVTASLTDLPDLRGEKYRASATVDVDDVFPNVDGVERKPVTVTVTNESGTTTTAEYRVPVSDTPPSLGALLGPKAFEIKTDSGYALTDPAGKLSDLAGIEFTITGAKAVSGDYRITPAPDIGTLYRYSTGEISLKAGTGLTLEISTPFGDITAQPPRKGIGVEGSASIDDRPLTFETTIKDVAYSVSRSIPTPLGATVQIPHVGEAEVGILGEFLLSTRPEISFDVTPRGQLIDPGSVRVSLPTKMRVGGSASLQSGLDFSKISGKLGAKVLAVAGPDLPRARVVPDPTLGQINGTFEIVGQVCAGVCYTGPLWSKTVTIAKSPLGGTTSTATPSANAVAGPLSTTGGGPATGSVRAAETGQGAVTALTNGSTADRGVAVARTDDGTVTAVWARQRSAKPAIDGIDIVAATRTGGTWSRPRSVTDDGVTDTAPSIATAGNDTLIAWAKARDRVSAASAPGGYDIAVSTATGGGWANATRLTNGTALHLAPEAAGIRTPNGTRWLVAWFADADGDISTGDDGSVRYAVLNDSAGVVATGRFRNRSAVAVTRDDGRFLVGTAAGSGDGAAVVRTRLAPNGTVESTDYLSAPNVTALTAGPDGGIAWVADATTGRSVTVLRGFQTSTLSLGNVTVGGVRLTAVAGRDALIVRPAGPGRSRPTVAVEGSRGWTDPRPLAYPPNRSATGIAALSPGRELLVATSGSPVGGSDTDVFAIRQSVRPDLRVNATAARAANGSAVVTYTVENRGLQTSGPTALAIADATGSLATERVPPLGVGANATGNVTVPIAGDGGISLTVDPDDTVAETVEANNEARVRTARPRVAITDLTARRIDGRPAVVVGLRNDGPVRADRVPLRITAGSATATATVRGLGPGNEWTETVPLDRSVSGPVVVEATVDPDDLTPITGNDTTARTTAFRPDLAVADAIIAYDDGTAARVFLSNGGTGGATAVVNVSVGNATRTATVSMAGAAGPNRSRSVAARVPAPNLSVGDLATVTVRPRDGVDAAVGDNVATVAVRAIRNGTGLPAGNVDGDPLLEDLDRNGRLNRTDALVYFRERDRAFVRNSPSAFDFDGDGVAGTVADALALYEAAAD